MQMQTERLDDVLSMSPLVARGTFDLGNRQVIRSASKHSLFSLSPTLDPNANAHGAALNGPATASISANTTATANATANAAASAAGGQSKNTATTTSSTTAATTAKPKEALKLFSPAATAAVASKYQAQQRRQEQQQRRGGAAGGGGHGRGGGGGGGGIAGGIGDRPAVNRQFTLPDVYKPHLFSVKNSERELWMHADSLADKELWIKAILDATETPVSIRLCYSGFTVHCVQIVTGGSVDYL